MRVDPGLRTEHASGKSKRLNQVLVYQWGQAVYGKGMVHCELVYTTDPEMTANWTRISPGRDFIPLGTPLGEGRGEWDSHICFASGVPVRMEQEIRVYCAH